MSTSQKIQLQINYQVAYTENLVSSGDNVRLTFITLNESNINVYDDNRYGLISIQAQIYGTSCQGNCILPLNVGDYFEVWTKSKKYSWIIK